MSWFQSGNLAHFAKSALKEAQKTIDKALDIKEDQSAGTAGVAAVAGAATDFFASWGVAVGSRKDEDVDSDSLNPTPNEKLDESSTSQSDKNPGNSLPSHLHQNEGVNVQKDTTTTTTTTESQITRCKSEQKMYEQTESLLIPSSIRRSLTSDIPVKLLAPSVSSFHDKNNYKDSSAPSLQESSSHQSNSQFQSLWLTEEGASETTAAANSSSDRVFNAFDDFNGQVEVLDEPSIPPVLVQPLTIISNNNNSSNVNPLPLKPTPKPNNINISEFYPKSNNNNNLLNKTVLLSSSSPEFQENSSSSLKQQNISNLQTISLVELNTVPSSEPVELNSSTSLTTNSLSNDIGLVVDNSQESILLYLSSFNNPSTESRTRETTSCTKSENENEVKLLDLDLEEQNQGTNNTTEEISTISSTIPQGNPSSQQQELNDDWDWPSSSTELIPEDNENQQVPLSLLPEELKSGEEIDEEKNSLTAQVPAFNSNNNTNQESKLTESVETVVEDDLSDAFEITTIEQISVQNFEAQDIVEQPFSEEKTSQIEALEAKEPQEQKHLETKSLSDASELDEGQSSQRCLSDALEIDQNSQGQGQSLQGSLTDALEIDQSQGQGQSSQGSLTDALEIDQNSQGQGQSCQGSLCDALEIDQRQGQGQISQGQGQIALEIDQRQGQGQISQGQGQVAETETDSISNSNAQSESETETETETKINQLPLSPIEISSTETIEVENCERERRSDSGEASENEQNSPKVSSRATSSISVLSGSEKESTSRSSPVLGGSSNSSNSNSDSPSFEIISIHSSSASGSNKQSHQEQQQHKAAPSSEVISSRPGQDLLFPESTEGNSNLICSESMDSTLQNSIPDNDNDNNLSNNDPEESCSSCSFERVDPPCNVSPVHHHHTHTKQHKKAASSASSSDIEVIPLDTERKMFQNAAKVYSAYHRHEVETQTDFPMILAPPEQPVKEKIVHITASEVSAKMASQVVEIMAEKDLEITQLREEGEKLSRKQFELSNVIKKLRGKEKEMENTTKALKNEIASKSIETERLMKSFVVKEGVEQTQNENISRLTTEKRKLELVGEQLRSELEDAQENCASMKISVENASTEIAELRHIISTAHRESAELDSLTREKSELTSRTEALQKEVEHLRSMVNTTQLKASSRESELKSQVSILTNKVYTLEDQVSDVSSEVADATMPLSLEIEKLQTELKLQHHQSNKRELLLQSKVSDLESKLKAAFEREKSYKDTRDTFESNIFNLESKIDSLESENRSLKTEIKNTIEERSKSEEKLSKLLQLEQRVSHLLGEVDRWRKENELLSNELRSERNQSELERKKVQQLQEQLNRNQNHGGGGGGHMMLHHNNGNNSNSQISHHHHPPGINSTSSVPMSSSTFINNKSGENSPSSQSIISEVSYLDEVFDQSSHHNNRSMTPKSFFETFSSANLIETLQNQLRLRETEVSQYLEEVSKNEKIRKTLNDEIAHLTVQNQELMMQMERMLELQAKLEELDKNYNAILQMYGEKVEEAEELRLDLQDVKEMYKVQLEQLLKK